MRRTARWLLGPLAGCVAATAVVFIFAKAETWVHEAMLPRCTHLEPTPDYVLCHDMGHSVTMTLIEQLGWLLAVAAFAATITVIAPARKRMVALACCAAGMAAGAFVAFDLKSVLPVVSSLLASAAITLWAFRRYAAADAA